MTRAASIREQALTEARRWIGTPYRHRASRRGAGCDCLGLVRGVWRALYGHEPESLPVYAPDWRAGTDNPDRLTEAAHRHLEAIPLLRILPGDVVLFRMPGSSCASHMAVISTGGTMIHAQSARAVCEAPMGPWWQRRLAGAFRFPVPAGEGGD